MGVSSLSKTVTRQRRDCNLNPGPSAPESSTLSSRLPSHPTLYRDEQKHGDRRSLTHLAPVRSVLLSNTDKYV